MFKIIKTSKGRQIRISPEDWNTLSKKHWYISTNGYVHACTKDDSLMHRLIMQTPQGLFTDHINGKKLDNRRENLRICTQLLNGRNRHKPYGSKHTLGGVRKMPPYGRKSRPWQAYTKVNYRFKSIGYFATKHAATRARRLYEERIQACITK